MDEIRYTERDKRITIPIDEFFKIWTGNILIVEPDENSCEPEYGKHFRKELFNNLRKIVAFSSIVFLLAFAFISHKSYLQPGVLLLLVISLTGAYIGYLLLLKQLHIQNSYADRLCSLFKYNDCNNILESDAAKLFGFLSWCEIGIGYFISNTLILCFLPSLIPCLLVINIFCLPYSVWSIWYQKIKAKQWCPLCLGTMLLLWGIFITGMGFGYTGFTSVTFRDLVISGCIYAISVLITNMLVTVLGRSSNLENIRYEINSIKADEDVFTALLRKQPRYDVTKGTSRILLGNTNSNLLVTVFSNPHCNPCSRMHQRINKLLEQNEHICVQYIFSSFNKELEISNKFLIGAYLQKNGDAKWIYDQWFEKGKFDKEAFYKKYPIDTEEQEVSREFELHEQWKEQSGLRATPTVLINGYKLPDNFKIEDMRHISELNI